MSLYLHIYFYIPIFSTSKYTASCSKYSTAVRKSNFIQLFNFASLKTPSELNAEVARILCFNSVGVHQ